MVTAASSPPVCKLRTLEPALLAERLRLPVRHAALLDLWRSPLMLLDTLVELELFAEAARLLVHALPEREAVWWACMCTTHTAPGELKAAEQMALDAAETWVRRLDEAARRAAAEAGRVRGHRLPGLWAARAAAWSAPVAGSAAATPFKPGTCGQAVGMAVTLASVRDATRRRKVRLARFIASGRDIVVGGAGRLPWEGEK
jgi:hypothetical protein